MHLLVHLSFKEGSREFAMFRILYSVRQVYYLFHIVHESDFLGGGGGGWGFHRKYIEGKSETFTEI